MHSAPRSNRRDFLTGQAAVDALTHLDVGGGQSLPALPAERYLVRLSRRAMACTFEVFLNAGEYPQGNEVALAALDLVDRLETQMSIYRETSEISQINRTAWLLPVEVESRLFDLLELANRLHDDTHGAFDVTAGRLSHVWGFTRRRGEVPPEHELAESLARVGSQNLGLDRVHRTVHFLRPGLEINLGSIGKGYALDRCAELFDSAAVGNYLLHGGNSSVLARGQHAGRSDHAWCVGIRNPLRPDQHLGHVLLRDQALGTSGSGTQFFMHEGRRLGHILDPRTGWPAEGVLTSTVVTGTAAQADALATAFYVMGPERAQAYCETHPGTGFVMVCPGPRAGSVEVHVAGLDQEVWRPVNRDPSDSNSGSTDRPV